MLPLFSLIIIISLSALITRVAGIALQHTGLSKESAGFQARSAYTGVGFTTTESEQVISHPVRRKIIMTLMLIGNAGIISAVATLMLTFVDKQDSSLEDRLTRVGILLGSVLLLWMISNSKALDRWLYDIVSHALRKYTKLNVRDYAKLLNFHGDYEISDLKVDKDEWLANKTLNELKLREEGVNLISITRKDGTYIGIPEGTTMIHPGDHLILYGKEVTLQKLHDRKANGSR